MTACPPPGGGGTTPTYTTTDSNGAFRLQVTHSGSVSLTVAKTCYGTAPAQTITVGAGGHDAGAGRRLLAHAAGVIALAPVSEPQGNDRFDLTPNAGGSTYTLTINCVRAIAAGEFTPTPVRVTDPSDSTRTITAATRLAGPLGSSGQNEKVTAIILPESLISIGERAFSSHIKVNGELIIPASVERIGKRSFSFLGGGMSEQHREKEA